MLKTRMYNAPWAIRPDVLKCFERDWQEVAALAISADDFSFPAAGSVSGGVGVIDMTGPISRYNDFFAWMFGAATVEGMMDSLDLMMADPNVKGILLNVNSPGGDVDGISELAGKISAASKIKPVVAYISGDGASAAYWLASAASKIIVNDTASVGSIGVYAAYMDYSKALEDAGMKEVVIVSSQSPRKRPDLLGDEGRLQIQAQIDALAQIFIDTVARNRGRSSDDVATNFGQGDIFIGQAAVDAGLADAVGTYETAMAEFVKNKTNGGKKAMTIDEVKASFPEVANALMAIGAEEERKRIQAIAELETTENAELVASFKWDGKTSASDVALAILKAKKESMKKLAEARASDAAEIPSVDTTVPETTEADDVKTEAKKIADAANRNKKGGK